MRRSGTVRVRTYTQLFAAARRLVLLQLPPLHLLLELVRDGSAHILDEILGSFLGAARAIGVRLLQRANGIDEVWRELAALEEVDHAAGRRDRDRDLSAGAATK